MKIDKNKRWELGLRDFRVKYRFFTQAEGGRMNPALQGYRSDWIYAEDYEQYGTGALLCMIWPWAVDEYGLEYSPHELMPSEGFADMCILFAESRPIHRRRIRVGVKGYFVEGSRRVAEAEVVDILYLNHDFGEVD
jgi:hypothetical protein